MKKHLNRETWGPSWVMAAFVLAVLALGYAWVSHQSLAEWKSLRSQLAVYAGKDFSAPGPVTAEVSDEMEGAVSNLIDTHGLDPVVVASGPSRRRSDLDDGRKLFFDTVVAQ